MASVPSAHPTARDFANSNTAKVEVKVSSKNLSNRDDFVCILYTSMFGSVKFVEHGKIQGLKDNLEVASETDKFVLRYFFEEVQNLCFVVVNLQSLKHAFESEIFDPNQNVGSKILCTLGEIIGAPGHTISKPLMPDGEVIGELILSVNRFVEKREFVQMKMQGHKLDKKDFFGKSDPYLIIKKQVAENRFDEIHTTEVIRNTLNPEWRPFHLLLNDINFLKVECYDYDNDGSHDFIGEFTTTLEQLTVDPYSKRFELINPKKKLQKKNYINSGTIEVVHNLNCEKEICFVDQISSMPLNFAVAIDFTKSNGDGSDSMHFIGSPPRPTEYIQVIQSIGHVVQDYNTDKLFSVFGFGAKVSGDDQVSDTFPLNLDAKSPVCLEMEGIRQAYQNCIEKIQPSEPINVAPAIEIITELVAGNGSSKYCVMLLIVSGIISDMNATKDAIIKASSLPISIIIVGIGAANFDAMEQLDTGEGPLMYNGQVTHRDMVQFVQFRDFTSGPAHSNVFLRQARLAKSVLVKIPIQMLTYMENKGIIDLN